MMSLLPYDPSCLLPTKEGYLQTKKVQYAKSIKEVKDQLMDLKHQAFILSEFGIYIRRKYMEVDRELASMDGRWKVFDKGVKAKVKKDSKSSTASFTADQVAAIAAALNISLED